MVSVEAWRASARELCEAVQSGRMSAQSIVEAFMDRIAETDGRIHAYARLDERARANARAIDRNAASRAGPLAGVPVAIKDNLVTQDLETRAGSQLLAGWVPPYDATVVSRLRGAGAVVLGKTNMDEFGMGSANENTPFDVVRNPWAEAHVSGGSSGGSAAAVAIGSCTVALGSDTGGSIRQPAALCGVVGLKPTWGRVSRAGLVAFASSLDTVGPLARRTRDVARVLSVIAGPDPNDASSVVDPHVVDYEAACEHGVAGLRIGVPSHLFDHGDVDESVMAAFRGALGKLAAAGARVVDCELPHARLGLAAYYVINMAEAASNLARYDGLRYGASEREPELAATYERTRASFGAEVKRRILLGTFALRAEHYDAQYGRAMRVRARLSHDYAVAFRSCDLVATPTAPTPAWPRGLERAPIDCFLGDVFTVGPSLAGIPSISVPSGMTDANSGPPRPLGLQLAAPHFAEARLLAAAAALEDRSDFAIRYPEDRP